VRKVFSFYSRTTAACVCLALVVGLLGTWVRFAPYPHVLPCCLLPIIHPEITHEHVILQLRVQRAGRSLQLSTRGKADILPESENKSAARVVRAQAKSVQWGTDCFCGNCEPVCTVTFTVNS